MSLTTLGNIRVSNEVSLSFSQSGPTHGPNVLLLAGWCQTKAQWEKQYYELRKTFRVTRFDYRGHGESETPKTGYRISRFAADLNAVILDLDLKDITVVCHSMGCSVLWSYWELFADSRVRIKRLVLIDQPACMIHPSPWALSENEEIGSLITSQDVSGMAEQLHSPDRAGFHRSFLKAMLTDKASKEDVDYIVEQNMLTAPVPAAKLLLDHAHQDWRDVIPTITVPTLVLAAQASMCPPTATRWLADNIAGARLVTLKAEEGGSHFMFWENPELFNKVVIEFINEEVAK